MCDFIRRDFVTHSLATRHDFMKESSVMPNLPRRFISTESRPIKHLIYLVDTSPGRDALASPSMSSAQQTRPSPTITSESTCLEALEPEAAVSPFPAHVNHRHSGKDDGLQWCANHVTVAGKMKGCDAAAGGKRLAPPMSVVC